MTEPFDRLIARVDAELAGAPDDWGLRNDRATLYWSRYEYTGHAADLEHTVAELRAIVAPSGSALPVLANLAGALASRAMAGGDLADLREAVELLRVVVARTAPDDPAYPGRQSNLGGTLMAYYHRTADSAVLMQARDAFTAALSGDPLDVDDAPAGRRETSEQDEDRAGRLSNLAECLRHVHVVTGDPALPARAVSLARAAARILPANHVLHPRMLSNLAHALVDAFHAGLPVSLPEAVGAARAALASTPAGHPNAVERHGGHAFVLLLAYEAFRDPALLNQCRRAARSAVAATPQTHPGRGRAMIVLGQAEFHHAQRTGQPPVAACDLFREMAGAAELPVALRVTAAHYWSLLAFLIPGRLPEAVRAFGLAVALLPQTAGRQHSADDQERLLGRYRHLAADAAACALTAGDAGLAVRLLEQGRGVLLAQSLDHWADVSELAAARPELAAEFIELRRLSEAEPTPTGTGTDVPTGRAAAGTGGGAAGIGRGTAGAGRGTAGIDAVTGGGAAGTGVVTGGGRVAEGAVVTGVGRAAEGDVATSVARADGRAALARRWSALLDEIRAVPGHEDFLAPPSLPRLLSASGPGPVVMVNVSALRSDALVLRDGRITVVPLPELTPDAVASATHRLTTAVSADGSLAELAQAAADLREVLRWLWHAVAAPVLAALGFTGPPAGGARTRLWWVPCGPLALLPLHAAADGHGVLDHVVSSYTPTLRSLLHHRGRPAPAPPQDGPLIVAMPRTPAAPALPHALREAEALTRLHPRAHVLRGPAATREAVLAELATRRWAHFACHADGPPDQPARSMLLLHDHERQPMTVRDLARLRLPHAELAYLSACATGHRGARLPDEAVHLTGAFHLAGFRQVVGTLWRVSDDVAADLATLVHERLADPADGPLEGAYALHDAVCRLRAKYPAAVAVWAGHVHVGL